MPSACFLGGPDGYALVLTPRAGLHPKKSACANPESEAAQNPTGANPESEAAQKPTVLTPRARLHENKER